MRTRVSSPSDNPSQLQSFEELWPVIELAVAELGTPLYVYMPHEAKTMLANISAALAGWGPGEVAFSVKTNPFHQLLKDLCRWGAYAEVVSKWEYALALHAGFSDNQIVVNGPMKTAADLHWMAERRPLAINIDSPEELEALETTIPSRTVRVGIRVCPPKVDKTWSRFGLQAETGELEHAIERIAKNPNLALTCIHFHLGTQMDKAHYLNAVQLAASLWKDYSLGSEVMLDIGGGLPYRHDCLPNEQPFSLEKFFVELRESWPLENRPKLLVEPGRFVAAPSFAIVSRVLSRKPRLEEPTIVVLDSGTNHNVMGAFYEHTWAYRKRTGTPQPFRICGPMCFEDDILSSAQRGPLPEPGSLVAMLNAGAYSFALSRTFIQPRPPIVTVESATAYHVAQIRERLEDAYALTDDGYHVGKGKHAAR